VQGTLRGWERNPPQGQPPGGGLQGATAVRTHLHGQGLSGAGPIRARVPQFLRLKAVFLIGGIAR
jgi:hypothetical protein